MADDKDTPQWRCSVVVPVRNGADIVHNCITALQAQTLPCEIVIVDDGSTDDTYATLQTIAGIKAITIEHGGATAARNAGAMAASGNLILFTDADCEPAPDWAEKLTAPIRAGGAIGARGVYRTRQRKLLPRWTQIEYMSKYERMLQYDNIDFIDTYSAAYDAHVFLENSGFDSSQTFGVEDHELSFRLAQKGYILKFVPTAYVYHTHHETLRAYLRRKFGIAFWKAYLLRRHPDKITGDTHTPPSQPLQIGLLGLALLLLPAAFFWPPILLVCLALMVIFFGSGWPLLRTMIRHDLPVLLISPLMLLSRAFVMGLGLVAGGIALSTRELQHDIGLSVGDTFGKRVIDVVGAVVGLLITGLLYPFVALAIKINTPGPVFYAQQRVGLHGRQFTIYKFRTMLQDADKMAPPVDKTTGIAPKSASDPRITRVGQLLRRWSIDELPQFVNVLRGDMSLVGPRPEEPRVVLHYTDWHRKRLAVKPGITGPMQVNGRGDLPLDERVTLELAYIEEYSLLHDIKILFRTLGVVFSGDGAY